MYKQKLFLSVMLLIVATLLPAVARSGEAKTDYTPLKKEIEKLTSAKGVTYGVFFQDLSSGKNFGINEEKQMPAASTVKLPMSLYLNTLAIEGKMDWNNRIKYQKLTDFEGGNGILRYEAGEGDCYSIRALNTLTILLSDNIAFRMLARHVGRENFKKFLKDLGGKTVYPGDKNLTTARDMGLYLQGVLDFVRLHPEEGRRMLDDLANSIYHTGLPGQLPGQVVVAHKEGDLDEGVANDIGIVFSSRPYLLVILSSGLNNVEEGFAQIAQISKAVYDYQEKLMSPK